MNDIAPASAATAPNLAEVKQQLEIEKLKLETRFIKRNHYAQLSNTAGLVLVGLLVFYFIQRPQVEVADATRVSAERQAEMSRLSTEKYQALSMYLTARDTKDDDERARKIQLVATVYSNQEWLAAIAKSEVAIDETKRAQLAALSQIRAEMSRAAAEMRDLTARFKNTLDDTVRQTAGTTSEKTTQDIRKLLDGLQDIQKTINIRTDDEQCTKVRADAQELASRLVQLRGQFDAEVNLGQEGRPRGLGPVARALQDQIAKTDAVLNATIPALRSCGSN
jgi:hypothetical protein